MTQSSVTRMRVDPDDRLASPQPGELIDSLNKFVLLFEDTDLYDDIDGKEVCVLRYRRRHPKIVEASKLVAPQVEQIPNVRPSLPQRPPEAFLRSQRR